MLFEFQVPTNRPSAYNSGVANGVECRRRVGKLSIFLLVAFNDDYRSGVRAGFLQRAQSKPGIANTV
jgi:hypothetical protein